MGDRDDIYTTAAGLSEDDRTTLAIELLPDDALQRVAELVMRDEASSRTLLAMELAEELASRRGPRE